MSILLIIAIVAVLSLGVVTVSQAKGKRGGDTVTQSDTLPMPTLSRAEIRAMLERVAESEPPTDLEPGAMCYEMAVPMTRADYVCPKCGNRTLYEDKYGMAEFVDGTIPACRRLVKEITGVRFELDESQFCRVCSRRVKDPTLNLIVHYDSADTPHRVEDINDYDLELIRELLSGSATYRGTHGEEHPLKDQLEHLEKLLGVDLKKRVPRDRTQD